MMTCDLCMHFLVATMFTVFADIVLRVYARLAMHLKLIKVETGRAAMPSYLHHLRFAAKTICQGRSFELYIIPL